MGKALELLDNDLNNSSYTDILFSIDEFGKFIEYGLEDINSNDIFDLQTLSEYVNKKSNYKLIISLHKAFSEYVGKLVDMTYTDWDKVQGRFENIVFKDDYYEMLNIFKETISLQKTTPIMESQNIIKKICNHTILKDSHTNIELFEKIAPIHPFSAIAISEIFTRYFQNQRSIFSFLFSTEPYAFQEFISQEQNQVILYGLADLYGYISYLLKVYTILLPDREIWYTAEYKLNDARIDSSIKKDIIKIIALIHTFKLSNSIKTDAEYLSLSMTEKYTAKEISITIQELQKDNILVYQEQTQSFSLLEDSNIDINKELNSRLSSNTTINYEKRLNNFILDKFSIAKRYFVQYGSQKSFEKIYSFGNERELSKNFKIYFSDKDKQEIQKQSSITTKSLFVPLDNIVHLKKLIKKIDSLEDIQEEFVARISIDTKEIITSMVNDAKITLESLLNENYTDSVILYNGKEYPYSSKQFQKLLSDIAEIAYKDAPVINNYTLNHTVSSKGTNTTSVKKLFDAMMKYSHKYNLGIEKFPAEKALYLSVIKPAGFHKEVKGKWILSEPDNLNFHNVWKFIEKNLSKKIYLESLIEELAKEPFGLNKSMALFVVSLFIIVNEETIHIVRDNTYTYNLTIDLLMNMWKATDKYQLERIKLSSKEANLFKAYVQITTDLTEYSYSKDKVSSIIKTLHGKFTVLPNYAKNTQKISKESIALRSAIISMKDPKDAFFRMFPNALGYKDIENIPNDEFTTKFKSAFNEIALSYKKEVIEFEKFFSEIFHFESQSFPYSNALVQLSEKLSKVKSLDTQTKALIRSFNYSDTLLALVNSISMILINKKLDECYDNDIVILRERLHDIANKTLLKLELAEVATETKDVRKVSLASLESNLNRVITIDKKKLDTINKEVLNLKQRIPKDYTPDEKLFLISQLLNEELKNE